MLFTCLLRWLRFWRFFGTKEDLEFHSFWKMFSENSLFLPWSVALAGGRRAEGKQIHRGGKWLCSTYRGAAIPGSCGFATCYGGW